MHSHGGKIMTRIRSGSIIESYSPTSLFSSQALAPSPDPLAMESSIMDPSDALASDDRDVMVNDVENTSPIHHTATMALMNGVTITITSNGSNNNNNNIGSVDEDDDKCGADKDGSDLRAIDFASAPSLLHHPEQQASVLDFDGSAVDVDSDGHGGMMMVDSMAVTEIAIGSTNSNSSSSNSNSSSSSSSNSSSSSSSSSSSNSSNSSSGSSSSDVASKQPKLAQLAPDEDEADEEVYDDHEEEEHGAHVEDEDCKQRVTYVGDESTDGKIMHADHDPLLHETINALMNGTGGIEVTNSPNPSTTTTVSTAIAAAVAAVAAEMNTERSVHDELETDRNYECTYCGKLFTRSNTLSYHLKVHTGERPFKCKHCSKAFREQYRLMKHLKTHAKCRNRREERDQEYTRVSNGREHLLRRGASLGHQLIGGKTLPPVEDDCVTGDSERFYEQYDLPDGTEVMKLEPDISLTEEGISEVPDADAMLTEEVMDDGPLSCEMDESTVAPGVTLADPNDIRHQIIEERIKSLQREVHLVNQNLNRVESKVDGLTRIISLLIEKFEDDVDPTGHIHQQRQAAAVSQTISTEDGSIVPVTSIVPVVSQQSEPTTPVSPSSSSCIPPKTLLHTSTSTQQNPVHQQTVYTTVATVGQPAQLQQTIVPLKEPRAGNTHYYQFTEPSIGHTKPTATTTAITVTPSQSPTPPPASALSQQLTIATSSSGSSSASLVTVNGNQLLDTFPEIPELPIRTVSDFLDLNDHCTDNEQFLLQMMIRLHQEIHNSQPFQRNIKRMMEALVTYEVLCQFSWSGKSAINGQYTKYVFGNSLGIIDLLTKTLNLGKSAEEAEANQKPIFSAIQSFIKHSRQNMIRDSRKRRDTTRAAGGGANVGSDSGGGMPSDGGGAISFHLNGSDRFQTKLMKSELSSHEPQEMVNPF